MAMTILRALYAEVLKMKRTIAPKIVVLFPVVVMLLGFFAVFETPFSTANINGIGEEWKTFTIGILRPWGLLMMPLFIALESAVVAGIDHSGNQWKSLLARPMPAWAPYIAKLILVVSMTATSALLVFCGILMDGAILPRVQSEVVFGFPIPWAAMCRQSAEIFGLAFLTLTIQHWVSLRWQSFSVAIGVGIVGTVLGVAVANAADQLGGWALFFPWALPMLVLDRQPHDIEAGLLISSALGLVVTLVGCFEFCRREVN
jgi:hypothetical protein